MTSLWNRMRSRAPDEDDVRLSLADYTNALGSFGLGVPYAEHTENGKPVEIDTSFIPYVQQVYKQSGVVFACEQARATVFSEAVFAMQDVVDGRPGDLHDSPDLQIFRRPWPNGTTGDLLMRMIQDADMAGNAYILKDRGGPGARLRRLRPDWVSIVLTAPPDKAVASDIEGYIYKPGGTADKSTWSYYPIDGSNGVIAHWAPIPDPEASYRGMSWLQPVMSEITADKQISAHKNNFFKNAATPNLAVSFKESVGPEQLEEFVKKMDRKHGGVRNAYKTLYLGGGADVKVVGADLRQMDFRVVQGASETRIAAAAGVHPAIVGLSEGLQGSSLNEGNFAAARIGFGDRTLRPLWRTLCASLSVLIPERTGLRLWYDDRDIPFLRQDRKDEAEIASQNATAISKFIMNGFEPVSVVDWVSSRYDYKVLKHTGLISVQLLPPEPPSAENGTAPAPKADAGGDLSKSNDPAVKKLAKTDPAAAKAKVNGSGNAGAKAAPVDPKKSGAIGGKATPKRMEFTFAAGTSQEKIDEVLARMQEEGIMFSQEEGEE